ncbi:MAG: hypothetical protein WCT05_08280 [Lentisphaeria bacterium]
MTKSELSQYYYLQREIERHNDRIAELMAKAGYQSPSMSGIPGSGAVSDKVSRYASEIADIMSERRRLIDRSWKELAKIQRYILGISDSLTRQIFDLRYAECKTWQQIANAVGGGNTADNVRMIHNNYLIRH